MHDFFRSITIFLLIAVNLLNKSNTNSVPEDLLTDEDEQLANLKRENLIDSILNQLSFLGKSKNENEEDGMEHRVGDSKSATVPLMSVFPSASSFNSIDIRSIKVSLSSNVSTAKSVFTNITNSSITAIVKPTEIFVNVSSSMITNVSSTVNLIASNSTLVRSLNASLVSSIASNTSFIAPLVTSINFSTTPLSITSPPAPHSTRLIQDTAQTKVTPTSTVFGAKRKTVASSILKPNTIKPNILPDRTFPAHTDKPDFHETNPTGSKKMPTLPDENGYGGYTPTEIKNQKVKGIGFVYVNVLLPIVSGVAGALLISIAILLCRCCRRRRLKKVRYFGGKPSRDFVQLDRMNLLTDTSDEDDLE